MLSERCSHSLIYINNKIINNEIFAIGGYNNNTITEFSEENTMREDKLDLNVQEIRKQMHEPLNKNKEMIINNYENMKI